MKRASVVLLLAINALAQEPNATSCLGFVRTGDIYLQCGKSIAQITHSRNIDQFAVNPAGTTLAVRRHRKSPNGPMYDIETLQLPNGKWSGTTQRGISLVQACGTILALEPMNNGYAFHEVRSNGAPLPTPSPFRYAVCSSDRESFVGLVGDSLVASRFGASQHRLVANVGKDNSIQFAISANGKYIAYMALSTHISLCIATVDETTADCTLEGAYPPLGLVISDEGDLAFGGSDDGCWYSDKRLAARGDCLDLYTWSKGQQAPARLSRGAFPQWLSALQSSALKKFSEGARAVR